jgi:hypothetical protein
MSFGTDENQDYLSRYSYHRAARYQNKENATTGSSAEAERVRCLDVDV